MAIERVFIGTDNINVVRVLNDGSPVPFISVTRIVVELLDLGTTLDSSIVNFVDWSLGDGKLKFYWDEVSGLVTGRVQVRVRVYDPDHDDGQIIVHESDEDPLVFEFLEG